MAAQVLGASLALAFWSACYALQPSRTFMQPATRALMRNGALQRSYSAALTRAASITQRAPFLKGRCAPPSKQCVLLPVGRVADGAHSPSLCWRRDAPRVTLALAESISLRAVIKPLTFPLKIWASYKLVLAMKPARRGGAATASVAMRYKRRQRQPAVS